MNLLHFRASLRSRAFDLVEDPIASRLWHGLRKAFPMALAAILMPDHLHIILRALDMLAARRRLRAALRGAAWGLGRGTWRPLEMPRVIPNLKHLRRQVRYIHLNPCRDDLVDDPLRWLWSTHRDVMGATLDPWVEPARLGEELRWPSWGFQDEFHHYVSSDPSVDVRGTPPPTRFANEAGSIPDLDQVIGAVSAASRQTASDTLETPASRRLFLSLAQAVGWTDASLLAEIAGVTRRTVERNNRPLDAPTLDTLLLNLGDDRLLEPEPPRSRMRAPRLEAIAAKTPALSPTTKSDFLSPCATFPRSRGSRFGPMSY